jgi:ribosome-associated protein
VTLGSVRMGVVFSPKGPTLSSDLIPHHADTTDTIRSLAIAAARAADDKKANDVVVLDVGDTIGITDVFVIASAPNTRLVSFLAEEVERAVKAGGGGGPIASEGLEDSNWVLLDFGGFIVHLFLEETRRFYDLERLWADAPKLDWSTRYVEFDHHGAPSERS